MKKLTSAQERILRAIVRQGLPPNCTRIDTLQRMYQAGLIAPMADRNEPWRITAEGRKALERAEGEAACKALGERLNAVFF